ncbi:MAG: hypothetical protein IH616_22485 [Gemmatimonadales bacterium]|nr:hypothetical protein [Gemmatimonadales bacterium]
MFRRTHRSLALVAALAIIPILACSDSNGVDGTPQDFTGAYTLVSFSVGVANNVVEIPGSVGNVTLTATTYNANFTIPGEGQTIDQGTYTATGTATAGTWTQQSTLDPLIQYSGTYAYNATTDQLTLDTTVQAIRTVIVLQLD